MKKRFTEEQIVRILGEAAGHGVPTTARKYGVLEQTLTDAEITIADQQVTIRRRGSNTLCVARILGIDRDAGGKPRHYWLDRVIHRHGERLLGQYAVKGALVTELTLAGPAGLEK